MPHTIAAWSKKQMKFKEFTHPQKVYDGFFETYFIRPFAHHYADFHGKESPRSALRSLIAWLILTLGVTGIMMGQVGLLGPEVGFTALLVVEIIWIAASVTPLLALLARSRSGAPEAVKKVKFLGVDTLLGVSSILFFLLGLLMMITTLQSGQLDPNANATDENDTIRFEEEYVKEEPIFTYQDETASDAPADSMRDLEDQDAATPDESYDPTLATPADDYTDTTSYF